MAEQSIPFSAMIDPDYAGFYNPLDMPAAIETFCRHTNQSAPRSIGAIARTVLEGLAMKYRMVLDQLELLSGKKYNVIHIIRGGSQNTLLCQFTANATGRKVVTGPIEATATGNILMQAKGMGYLENLAAMRKVVNNSFELLTYEPQERDMWEEAYTKFKTIAKHI